jgi:5,10-methylenetetrahydromethanopterin reductase
MQIGLFLERPTVADLVADVTTAVERGFRSVWVPQIFGLDALTALAVVANEVPDVALGTAVVPTYPRHPMMLAAQARTLQQVSGGRFTLGIGLSHQIVIETMMGMSFEKPVRHLREYLDVLLPLVRGESASSAGDTLTFHGDLQIESDPVPVLVAALGTQMLTLAGKRAEGTITWMTGPATISDHVVPTITAAAGAAGRPSPRVVAALPVAVTDDPDAARAKAASLFEIYGHLPSYRAMLDREGAAGPADVALVGDEETVLAGITSMFAAGATEFVAVPFTSLDRTYDLLTPLLD